MSSSDGRDQQLGVAGAAAAELDEGRPGQPVLRDLGGGVGLDRGVGLHPNLREHPPRIVRGQSAASPRADRNAVVAHAAALGQAGDGFVEDDAVGAPFLLGRPVRRPQREQEAEEPHREGEHTDQDVIGFRFHACQCSCRARIMPAMAEARAARARGPWKYSCTHGMVARSTSAIGASITSLRSASTAMRSQIAYRVSRSWVTGTR